MFTAITKKLSKIVLVLFCIAAPVAYFLVENVLPYAGIKPMRRHAEDFKMMMPGGIRPEDYGLQARAVTIRTPDSLTLSGLWITPAGADTLKGAVVVIHGISGCKETQLLKAKMLTQAGFAAMLIDLRAHGLSSGEYCTFGFKEKFDLKAVADSVVQWCPNGPIGIWGASLGGAVALQTMAITPTYNFGIVESTFDTFEKVALEYGADWMFGLRSTWLRDRVLAKSGKIADFDPAAVKPVESAAKLQVPVLFIHGDKDSRIPMWFGQRNYEACPSPKKEWIKVAGAGHLDVWKTGGQTLSDSLTSFLQRQL